MVTETPDSDVIVPSVN